MPSVLGLVILFLPALSLTCDSHIPQVLIQCYYVQGCSSLCIAFECMARLTPSSWVFPTIPIQLVPEHYDQKPQNSLMIWYFLWAELAFSSHFWVRKTIFTSDYFIHNLCFISNSIWISLDILQLKRENRQMSIPLGTASVQEGHMI